MSFTSTPRTSWFGGGGRESVPHCGADSLLQALVATELTTIRAETKSSQEQATIEEKVDSSSQSDDSLAEEEGTTGAMVAVQKGTRVSPWKQRRERQKVAEIIVRINTEFERN